MKELPACLNYMFRQGHFFCVAISLFIFLPTILSSEQNYLSLDLIEAETGILLQIL